MLESQEDESIKTGEPVRSSQLDISQLRAVIKKTYFELLATPNPSHPCFKH